MIYTKTVALMILFLLLAALIIYSLLALVRASEIANYQIHIMAEGASSPEIGR